MPLMIRKAHAAEPAVAGLLDASRALMSGLFAAEENHALDAEALTGMDVTMWAADDAGAVLGCVALKACDGYGEVKSLFVAPEARGHGVADLLMTALESQARDSGLACLRLETGDTLTAALRLYEARGFRRRGPFGEYPDLGASVFMEKKLR